jgi:hypothetical protein
MKVSRLAFLIQGENKHETHPAHHRHSLDVSQYNSSSDGGACRWWKRRRQLFRRHFAMQAVVVEGTLQKTDRAYSGIADKGS